VKLKLFIAVDLDEPARDLVAVAIQKLQSAGIDARFEPREKWHSTLAFLGWVEDERYAAVREALAIAAARCRPFDLRLDCVGAFPSTARPRVIWIGGRDAQPGYDAVSKGVRVAYEALGFAFERDAVPHVTVCRLKSFRGPLPEVALPTVAIAKVDSLTLYQSIPAGRTTRYALREKIRLGL